MNSSLPGAVEEPRRLAALRDLAVLRRWHAKRRDQVVGKTLGEFLGPAEYERLHPRIERVLAGESVTFEMDSTQRSGVRTLCANLIPMWLDTGVVDGFVSVAQDVTDHRQEADRLRRLSRNDPLTGLQNRAGFEACLEDGVQSGAAPEMALLYIDLDHFKPVNDQHGHAVGDQVLRIFAQRLQRLVRPSDLVARLGGDEFAVVLAGIQDASHAHAVADKVVEAAGQPIEVGSLSLRIGASVGVAFGADPALGWQELLERADRMLYRARAAGRGRRFGD